MTLRDWLANGWLIEHRASANEIRDLLEVADSEILVQLDQFRKKRNIGGYERVGTVSEQEAAEMHALAGRLRVQVEQWLRRTRPDVIEI